MPKFKHKSTTKLSKNKKFNFGAFPANKEGLGMARSWAEKMTEETGEKFMVKKR